jgi:hypothetical protein
MFDTSSVNSINWFITGLRGELLQTRMWASSFIKMRESLDQLSGSLPGKIAGELLYITQKTSYFPSGLLCCEHKPSYGPDARYLPQYLRGFGYRFCKNFRTNWDSLETHESF